MNAFFLRIPATLLCIAAFSSLPARAANEATPVPQRIDITAPRAAAADTVHALRDIDTTYELSNGRRMVVTSWGDALTMRYANRLPRVLRHDGGGNFVSADGTVTLSFEVDASGHPQIVRLTAAATWF